jgi:putative membrane protein
MVGFVIRLVISAIGLWVASLIVPGVGFRDTMTLVEAAVLLGLANAIVRPILVILTLPVTILTLGLFLLVINAGMIFLVAHFLRGFHVPNFTAAILTAIVTGVVSWIGHGLTEERRER